MRIALAAVVAALAMPVAGAQAVNQHRSHCHVEHSCPSDHATYKWNGQWCVSPTADERSARFTTRVEYAGRVYYCHR
jgi:hypothetical protein